MSALTEEVRLYLLEKYDRGGANLFTDKELDKHDKKIAQATKLEILTNEKNWLYSILQTKHMSEDNKWIIEARILKVNGWLEKKVKEKWK